MMFEVDSSTLKTSLKGTTPVYFSYLKKNGTMRNAIGTLHPEIIPENMKPKDPSINKSGNLRYFDLEKNAWRSLSKDCSKIIIIE